MTQTILGEYFKKIFPYFWGVNNHDLRCEAISGLCHKALETSAECRVDTA